MCVLCRQALFLHRQALTEQLKDTEDPALVLHLTSVLLFQATTHSMLHAPGRCVPQIIGTLIGRIPTVRLTLTQRSLSVKQEIALWEIISGLNALARHKGQLKEVINSYLE